MKNESRELPKSDVAFARWLERATEALALWKEWFSEDGDPVYGCGMSGDEFCFFCGNLSPTVIGHADNCIYIRAKYLATGSNIGDIVDGTMTEEAKRSVIEKVREMYAVLHLDEEDGA